MLGHARTCSDMLGHVRRCSDMLGHARTCSGMLGHARTCSGMPRASCLRALRAQCSARALPSDVCSHRSVLNRSAPCHIKERPNAREVVPKPWGVDDNDEEVVRDTQRQVWKNYDKFADNIRKDYQGTRGDALKGGDALEERCARWGDALQGRCARG